MLIDLTLSINQNDPIIAKASADQKSLFSGGHIGTHLDIVGDDTPQPPIECVKRRGIVIDVEGARMTEIGLSAIENLDIRDGDFVIFYTGHLKAHGYATRTYYEEQPRLSWELINHLASSGISMIGLDFPGVRPVKGLDGAPEHGPADELCGRNGKYIVENLNNVDQLHAAVGDQPFEIISGWTGFVGASGLHCKVTAVVD